MRIKLRSIVLIVLCVMLVATLTCMVVACNKSDDVDPDDYQEILRYELNVNQQSYSVVGMNVETKQLVIPSQFNGLPVTSISDGCSPIAAA